MIHKKVTAQDITLFLQQLAMLISTAIPIIQGIDILAKSASHTTLRSILYSMKRDISSGKSLFYCFTKHAQYFDGFACKLIQIGEQTGKLETMLHIIASYYEKNQEQKQRLRQALFYPCLVTLTAILITLCMLIFVIPRFSELFQHTQIQLPFITICIFYISEKFAQLCWLISGIILCSSLILLYFEKKIFFNYLQNIIINLPIIKNYRYKSNLMKFSRYLALTIAAGIPTTNALLLISNSNGHDKFATVIFQLHRKMSAGLALHQAMIAANTFPALLIQMIKIGEESGTLEIMLNKFTALIEVDLHHFMQRLNTLLEPLIMIVLGVLIGGLVIGMYLPIFNLGNTI